ncbi:hypothetical protein MKW94_012417 [Papaver nudicaule]|uniref:Uncharacterized protein n=1 Tax=Papaver nudicaule TaxID=74823 RepID=A0AA41RUI0_PAPNU|nr:hypothetical protein [Papaver nudicaule]
MSKRAAISLSSGSEGGGLDDERKKKRMKQQHLDELINQAAQLQKENDEIVRRVNHTTEVFSKVDSENNILRAQMAELRVIEEISGFQSGHFLPCE